MVEGKYIFSYGKGFVIVKFVKFMRNGDGFGYLLYVFWGLDICYYSKSYF